MNTLAASPPPSIGSHHTSEMTPSPIPEPPPWDRYRRNLGQPPATAIHRHVPERLTTPSPNRDVPLPPTAGRRPVSTTVRSRVRTAASAPEQPICISAPRVPRQPKDVHSDGYGSHPVAVGPPLQFTERGRLGPVQAVALGPSEGVIPSPGSVIVVDTTLRQFCRYLVDHHPDTTSFAQVARPQIEGYKKRSRRTSHTQGQCGQPEPSPHPAGHATHVL
jgi:hypothetical protein